MFPAAVAGEAEDHRRRGGPTKGAIVAHIGPEPRGFRAATGQQRHRGVIAMQPGGGEHMRLDQRVQRRQQLGHRADLVGERGQAEIHALAGIAVGLAVQGLMLAVLFEHDHGEQAGTGPAARDRVERGGRLADLFAGPAGELLADGLDDLPLPRHHLQRFGDVLAHLHDPVRPAARAGRGSLDHHALARQMFGKGFLDGLAPFEARPGSSSLPPVRPGLVLGGVGDQFLELQLQLVDEPGGPFRAAAILVALEDRDLQLERRDHRLGGRDHRAGLRKIGLGSRGTPFRRGECRAQFCEFGGGLGHGQKSTMPALESLSETRLRARFIPPLQGVASSADCASRCPPEDSRAGPPRSVPPRHYRCSAR